MEKAYEEVIAQVKSAYLSACWNLGYANAYNYNGSSSYEIEMTSFAEGKETGLKWLMEQLEIVVSQEEINKAEEEGRKEALEE